MFRDDPSRMEGAAIIPTLFHVTHRDIEKFQERSADHHSSTYVIRSVGVEDRIMNDKSSIINVDCSSVLKVVCGPPGIGAKI